jgi:general secretion pathway protein F
MPAFSYSALDKQEKVKKGILESDNAKQARQQLRNQGLKPLEVNPVNGQKRQTKQVKSCCSARLSARPICLYSPVS